MLRQQHTSLETLWETILHYLGPLLGSFIQAENPQYQMNGMLVIAHQEWYIHLSLYQNRKRKQTNGPHV